MAIFKAYNPNTGAYAAISGYLHLCQSKIKISSLQSSSSQIVTLKNGSAVIFKREFYPMNGEIDIDIYNDIVDLLKLYPNLSEDTGQTSSYISLSLECAYSTINFNMHLSEVKNSSDDDKLTDLETVSIPRDTVLKLAVYNAAMQEQEQSYTVPLYVLTNRRKTLIETHEFYNFEDQLHLFLNLDVKSLPVAEGDSFRLVWGTSDDTQQTPAPSPTYRVVPGRCEQYLFLNKYGVWDQIAMYGSLTYQPEHTIKTASSSSSRFRLQAQMEPCYLQNTGYLSRHTMRILSELMCSRQIFHLLNGTWQEIIVDEPEMAINSFDTVHSGSFKFRYADKTIYNNI